VGSIIATTNCQDLTELGGLGSRMPATTTAYLVGSAGLVGLLPLGCFWCFGMLLEGFASQHPFFAAVVLLTNGLTAFNFVRVFRHVFMGPSLPKTKRAPEVNWLMALPMVSLTVLVALMPAMMNRLDPAPSLGFFPWPVAAALAASGLVGAVGGALVPLNKFWSRSTLRPLRLLQDLLASDFYTDRIYRATIVAAVAGLARLTDWVDRTLVNGLVNGIGRFSLASAEGLKLGVSGQLQSYVLTVVAAILLLLASLQWLPLHWWQG
jgi:NAD(P)H-quinone oxidoreductase subunit 5